MFVALLFILARDDQQAKALQLHGTGQGVVCCHALLQSEAHVYLLRWLHTVQ